MKEVGKLDIGGNFISKVTLNECYGSISECMDHLEFDGGIGRGRPSPNNAMVDINNINGVNLLDLLGANWRDVSQWWVGNGNTIRYLPEYDTLEFTRTSGVDTTTTLKCLIPLLNEYGLIISGEWMQLHSTIPVRLYVGDTQLDVNGGQLGGGSVNYTPGTWDYTGVGGEISSTPTWRTFSNNYAGNKPRKGIGTAQANYKTANGKFLRPLLLPNYGDPKAIGSKVLIRNLSFKYVDSPKMALPTQASGLCAIASGVKNLIPNISNSFSPWGVMSGSSVMTTGIGGRPAVHLKSRINLDSKSSGAGVCYAYSAQTAATAGSTYTASCIVRSNKPITGSTLANILYLRSYNAKGVQVEEVGLGYHTKYLGDNTYQVWGSRALKATTTKVSISSYCYSFDYDITIQDYQLTLGTNLYGFLGYSKTSTPTYGKFNLRALSKFTVIGKFSPASSISNSSSTINSYTNTANQGVLFGLYNSDGKGIKYCYWTDSNLGLVADPFMNCDLADASWGGTGHYHCHHTGWSAGDDVYFVATCDGTSLCIELINSGGKIITTHKKSGLKSPKLSEITLGDYTSWSATHHSLTVYDEALSASDVLAAIDKLNKSGITLSEYQNRIKFIESPIALGGVGVTSIPVTDITGLQTKDFGGGGASLRKHTNLIPNLPEIDYLGNVLSSNGWTDLRPHTRTIDTPYGRGVVWNDGSLSSHWANNSYGYIVHTFPMVKGKTYCASAWVFVSSDWNGTNRALSFETNIGGSCNFDGSKTGVWQLVKQTGVAGITGNGRFLIYPGVNGNMSGTVSGSLIIASPAVVLGSTPELPYNGNGTFGLVKLKTDYGLDITKDFTLAYHKTPINDFCGTRTQYNLESMGGSGAKGYMYWGHNNATNQLVLFVSLGGRGGSLTTSCSDADYYSGEQLVIIQKYGKDIHFTIRTGNGKIYTISFNNVVASTSSYLVSSSGYDLQMGSWQGSAANCSTNIYRNVSLVHGTLSMSSVDLARQTMNHGKLGTIIQNKLIEHK